MRRGVRGAADGDVDHRDIADALRRQKCSGLLWWLVITFSHFFFFQLLPLPASFLAPSASLPWWLVITLLPFVLELLPLYFAFLAPWMSRPSPWLLASYV